jgi:hypothetical protein
LGDVPKRFDEIPYDDYIKCYNSHIEAVEGYFKDRDNILIMDMEERQKGTKMALFLDKDYFPNSDFVRESPLANRTLSTFE